MGKKMNLKKRRRKRLKRRNLEAVDKDVVEPKKSLKKSMISKRRRTMMTDAVLAKRNQVEIQLVPGKVRASPSPKAEVSQMLAELVPPKRASLKLRSSSVDVVVVNVARMPRLMMRKKNQLTS